MIATSHNQLKMPLIMALFASEALTAIVPLDSNGNLSIYEGWHKPEEIEVDYPYITYRINWYPTIPTGFLNGTMIIDMWDHSPAGNDSRKIESLATILTLLYRQQILIDGITVIRCNIAGDEWIQDEEPGRIHRQVTIETKTIDLFVA